MSEKTAEEKLRQALEGSTTSSSSEPPKTQKKPKPSRTRPKAVSLRTVKSESIGERLDSFMDDFERRIEQSINAVKSPSESHETSRRARISAEHKPETSRRVHKAVNTHPEPLEELIPSKHEALPVTDAIQEDLPVSQPETTPEISAYETSHATDTTQEDLPVSQPEAVPEISQHESSHVTDTVQEDLPVSQLETVPEASPVSQPETLPEISQPESLPITDTAQEDLSVSQPETVPEISQPESSHVTDATQEDLPVSQPETVPEISQHESSHVTDTVQEDLPVSQPETVPEISQHESSHATDTTQEDLPVSQPESTQEISQPESMPEEIIPDVMPLDEAEPSEEELPDIPVIEAAFDEVPETPQETYGDLPDIPVISADDEDDDTSEIFADGLEDIIPPADDEAEEPRKESHIDFQEAELIEAPEIDDDFADVDADTDDFTDEPLDEEPAAPDAEEETEDAPPYDIESDDAGIFADDVDDADDNDDVTDDTPGDFSPSADVVLNVDDEIPQISQPSETVNDPEAESVPVTVTMPESTRTAEDKLMADIAEAMTGNPLSLESLETPAYNIPENFFTEGANNGDSPQSAEDKLKANIAQALSESPINAAHEQARQSLEQDINPFEELSITEPEIEPHDEELLPEKSHDTEESLTEESLDDGEPLTEKSHDDEELLQEETNDDDNVDELMPDSAAVDENEDDTESLNDPFTIPDFPDDDTESEPSMKLESSEDETRFFTEAFTDDDAEEAAEPENDLDLMPKIDPEPETLQDIFTQPEEESEPEILRKPETGTEETPEPESESESAANDNDDMPFPVEEPEKTADELQKTPLTEQEALIAMLNQEFEPESSNFTAQEEAQPDNNMPEQSLLNDETPGTFEPEENHDDFDISSLGDELGQAATFADESEDFSASPATVTEMITQPEAGITHNPEDDHKEKTMNIREKLASRKNGNSESAPAGKSKSGLLLTVLTGLLAVIGGLILWQLMQVSDKITSLAMNAPGYESSARSETPSYDYAIDFILDPNLADRMAQRGRAGWQVVGSRRTQDSTTGQYGYEFIFMRRTPGR